MKKTYSKTQIPIYNALGPFPDETILSTIDHALYLICGKQIQKFFNSGGSAYRKSCCSRCSSEKDMTHRAIADGCGDCHVQESPTYSPVQDSKHSKFDAVSSSKSVKLSESILSHSHNTPSVVIKENSSRQESGKFGIPLRTLRRSFSLCSLACGKLREKLAFSQTGSAAKSASPPKWLWTKMENYADGSQVYEVFKNSSAASHPTKFDTSKASKIILIILPTGVIMPFETLPRH